LQLIALQGYVEKHLTALSDSKKDVFAVSCVRPSAILSSRANILEKIYGAMVAGIEDDHLARAMIKVLLEESSGRIIENDELRRG
jgi:hypothetical protein